MISIKKRSIGGINARNATRCRLPSFISHAAPLSDSQVSSAPLSSTVSVAEMAKERKLLSKAIDDAVKREDFKMAATCKRELEALNASDPFWSLNESLKQSIAEQQFGEAAKLKQAVSDLEKELGCSMPLLDPNDITTSSDTITRGIRIRIQSTYRPKESSPQLQQWFFSYKVSISNESEKIIQIRSRHWIITDADGKTEEVKGPGVVGHQPVLLPGKRFEYESACPLRTPTGMQEGTFGAWLLSEEDGEFKQEFEARINPFKHDSTVKQNLA